MHEEAEKTTKLSGASSRGLFGRVTLLDASHGDLTELIQFGDASRAHAPRGKASGGESRDDGSPFKEAPRPSPSSDSTPAIVFSSNGTEAGR
jgi:hypothetical protein